MERGRVTVVIPAFNAARFIDDAIASVLKQTYRPLELVVVDDGSTDATKEEVVRLTRDGPSGVDTKLVDLGENTGAANALFQGFSRAEGEFVSWLSADDIFVEANKTRRQVEAMEKGGADWSYFRRFYSGQDLSSARLVRPDGLVWKSVYMRLSERDPSFRVLSLLFQNPINGSSIMIRRSCIDRFGQFDPTLKNVDADGDLWMRYTLLGAKALAVEGAPVFYRLHPQQTSKKQLVMLHGMELTRLRILTTLSSLGLLERVISDHSTMLALMLTRGRLVEGAPFTTLFLCDQILGATSNSNLVLKSVARSARGRARQSIDSRGLDLRRMMEDVAASSATRTFADFVERMRQTATASPGRIAEGKMRT